MSEQRLTHSEMKRQAILEAAKTAFREDGVKGTSMDALAAKAQVSKRTVYNHFPSKEALVMHLMAEMWARAQQQIFVKYDPGKSLDLQLLTLVGSEIEVICDKEYIDLVRVAIGHYFYDPGALQDEAEKMAQQETALYRWLEAAAQDGRLAIDDVEFASGQLHHQVKGACFWPQVMGMAPIPEREEQRRLAEETIKMFLARYLIA